MLSQLKFISWNIKHFNGRSPKRLMRIIAYLKNIDADIISLYEIKGSKVFTILDAQLPGYVWNTTSGPQSQEILVGIREGLGTIGFEQTDSFKGGNNFLRPGMLTTLKLAGGDIYTFLSLHLKSSSDFLANAVREEQFAALYKLSKSLKRRGVKLVAFGDLNTMGLALPYGHGFDTAAEFEMKQRKMSNAGLRLIPKDSDHTWTPSKKSEYKKADLDHVLAHKGVKFAAQGKSGQDILVDWPKDYNPRSDRSAWYRAEMSDHAPLIGAVRL